MTDRTFRSFAVAWNECQNSFKPEHLFVEKAVDFLLTKSDWLTKPSAAKELADIVRDRVKKKKKADREEKEELARAAKAKAKAKASKKKKVTKPAKAKAKTTKVKDREAIDLTNLEPDNSNQEPSAEKSEPMKTDEDESDDEGTGQTPVNNGGFTDKYTWTQTLSEVDVRLEVPKLSSRSFVVVFKQKHLKVGIKGEDLIIDAELHAKIDPDESMWSMSEEVGFDGKVMTLNLVKKEGMCWWPKVCEGDPEINTKKIEPENSNLNDLDGDTRKVVEKMMFDQRQKAAGKPTSKEIEQQAMLKKFMAAHPEMDFSKCKMPGGGMGGFNMG